MNITMSGKPHRDELRAKKWLESQRVTDILDRTDGEGAPDFVVGGCIAVEVRRLNWMIGEKKGLEEIEQPCRNTLKKVLKSAGPPPSGYRVQVDFNSPCPPPDKAVVEREVGRAVKGYSESMRAALDSGRAPMADREGLACGIEIKYSPYVPRSGPTGDQSISKFELVNFHLVVPGRGLVVRDAIANINRCIRDKNKKSENNFHRYRKWWLVLVDNTIMVPPNLDEDEWEQIRNGLVETDRWSRIVVIDSNLWHFDLLEQFAQD